MSDLDELINRAKNIQDDKEDEVKQEDSKKKSSTFESICWPLSHLFVAASFAFLYPYKTNDSFYKDEYLRTKTLMDANGVISFENQFEDFEENEDLLYYYGNWQQDETGKFIRKIKIYNLKPTKYGINSILKGNVENLDELFGKPIAENIEQKTTITSKEYEEEPYLKAILYDNITSVYETRLIPADKFSIDTIFNVLCCLSVEVAMVYLHSYVRKIDKEKNDTSEKVKKLKID